jgi:hypothetical protein
MLLCDQRKDYASEVALEGHEGTSGLLVGRLSTDDAQAALRLSRSALQYSAANMITEREAGSRQAM